VGNPSEITKGDYFRVENNIAINPSLVYLAIEDGQDGEKEGDIQIKSVLANGAFILQERAKAAELLLKILLADLNSGAPIEQDCTVHKNIRAHMLKYCPKEGLHDIPTTKLVKKKKAPAKKKAEVAQ